ncbi:MAG: hypothetical protein IPM38_11295 [Ignavibacteria bacterium]|nr:hypothetical protein [Ignavibacteria bacterium]
MYFFDINKTAIYDSAKIVLENDAVLILPEDFNLHLRGNTTSLIMKPIKDDVWQELRDSL